MTGAIDLAPDGKSLLIRFPYREDLVEEVRLIPGRRWDRDAKVWKVPVLQVDLVASTFRPHGFCLAPEVADLLGPPPATTPGEPTLPFVAAPDPRTEDTGRPATVGRHPEAGEPHQRGPEDQGPAERTECRPVSVAARGSALSIRALNERVRRALRAGVPEPLWIVGEVLDFDKGQNRRHAFFSLVEKTPGRDELAAKVEVALFASTWERLAKLLRENGGLTLRDGIEVRALVRVDLYPPSGRYQVVLEDIDPSFTLGKMALTREAILAELRQLGLDRANAARPLPVPALRVGVLTSLDSDGWTDFRKQLESSRLGFSVACYGVRVQGPELRRTMLAGLRWFAERCADFDVLCILRGGGSRSDLAWFDDRDVALAVARHPLAVLCGIGHQRDQSVLDLIARSQKTPTAVGAWLVDEVRAAARRLEDHARRLPEAARAALAAARERHARVAATLVRQVRARVRGEQQVLAEASLRTGRGTRAALRQQRDCRDRDAADLQRGARLALERATARIDGAAARQRLLDPARVLERGYALVRDREGRFVRHSRALRAGMELDIAFADGHAHATTTRVFEDREQT